MKHLGDITKINGAAVEPVEVIIGGSPCQDLSVAGKRAGLNGERSGLFMEQIRIIKEMREHDRQNGATYIRPRYMVWENVPGAFSSNKGEDFRIVLEETARVVEPTAVIPRPEKRGWTNAGAIVGDGWSIAWRVFDAQFWGVPQRRRRIALIGDFGGATAPEILFERKGVFGDITQSTTPWKDFAAAIAKRFGSTNQAERGTDHLTYCIQENSIDRSDTAGCNGKGVKEGVSYTLNTIDRPAVYDYDRRHDKCQGVEVAPTVTRFFGTRGEHTCDCIGVDFYSLGITGRYAMTLMSSRTDQNHVPSVLLLDDQGGAVMNATENAKVAPTLRGQMGGHPPCVLCIRERCGCAGGGKGLLIQKDKSGTLAANNDQFTVCIGNGQADNIRPTEKAGTLNCMHDQQAIITLDRAAFNQGKNAQYDFKVDDEGVNSTIVSKDPSAICSQSNVRRLTPLECERLQGFPDGWSNIGDYIDTKGKKRKTSDSARYKALGNSIALPSWAWLLERLNRYCRYHTMASLFDGIGGFPLIWETLNGSGSCIWASEIEEFPIAVTKYHFGENI